MNEIALGKVIEMAGILCATFFSICSRKGKYVAVIFEGIGEQHSATWYIENGYDSDVHHEYHGHARHIRNERLGKVKYENYDLGWNPKSCQKEWMKRK